ncbi:glycoside hydrolase family 3 N-terminal domain-containing protein [Amycolatopsis mongoliensis]|uniref:Glycoside hydrolase family 3 N-terminal domain-containing protein n=1 Tax=Amycolatopsis mongoliensis TaxID=715475 RepID=A0A9Y2JJX8_9PSEU|nr:glycoside hydrolase family 3 N-terminal domain-containing protein [Amycolatopsis sp. 4-36]WIX98233.1 glycoside hydrolase family 3 N-terminal domain-containing protein [Amycolatopsis sp. 4-36]
MKLSLRSRIGQVNQRLKGWEALRWTDGAPRVTDVLRREVDRFGGIGAIYGVLRADPWSAVHWHNGIPPERSAEAYAAVQDYVTRNGDGIPVLFVEEAPHGLQALGGTTLPVNLALGAGMDADLTEELAAAVAAEARARGTHVALVSGLDVLRDPRWGRAEECFGEDPALAALLVAATVRGMQGGSTGAEPIDAGHVAVVAKHFAAQGAGIGGRNGSGAPIGSRELGEIHLRPAFAAARLGVAGFMAAYNDIDGVPCSANRALLTGKLRGEWGWDGVVMADGTAIDRLRDSAPDPAAAAALALRAGVDLSLWDEAFTHLEAALDRGLADERDLDRAVDRVLALKRRVGLFGEQAPPSPPARDIATLVDRAARQAVVLVHDRGVLPLDPDVTIALIGPNADDLAAQLGDYTPPRHADDPGASTVRSALGDRARYTPGSRVRTALGQEALAAVDEVIARAGVCVLVLGGTSRRGYDDEFADNGAVDGPAPDTTNGEGVDLASIALPEPQLDLARRARASGKPIVTVVIDGRPRALTELAELSDALLVVPFPGPSGGAAIVSALFDGTGSGRLPASFPVADGVFPVAHDERMETARGYLDHPRPVGIPFGSGASLPAVVRAAPGTVPAADLGRGSAVRLTVDITNPGAAPVSVAVPLYGRRHELGVRPRRRSLLTVRRVTCPPGETTIEFELGLDELGSWATGRPVAVPVEVDVWSTGETGHAVRVRVTDEDGTTPWQR